MAFVNFQTQCLNQRQAPFFDRLPKMQLKTFEYAQKKVSKKILKKDQVIKSDNKLFGQMLLVASSRNLNMRDVLKHPLSPLPWSLANCNGTMKTTNKAALARKLEKLVSATEQVQQPSACMRDGMSLMQKLTGKNHTFDEVASMLLTTVLNISTTFIWVDVIFDVY